MGAGAASYAIQDQRVRDERATAAAERARAEGIEALLAAPDAVVRNAPVAGGGRVTVISSASLDRGAVLFDDLPDPGTGKAYQMWRINAAGPVSAGVLPPGAQPDTTRFLDTVRGMDTFGLTVEDLPGAKQPSLPPVAAVTMT